MASGGVRCGAANAANSNAGEKGGMLARPLPRVSLGALAPLPSPRPKYAVLTCTALAHPRERRTSPLEPMSINFGPNARALLEETCSVCLNPLSDASNGGPAVILHPCLHVLHFNCWSRWAERRRTCPECRASVTAPPFGNVHGAVGGLWRFTPPAADADESDESDESASRVAAIAAARAERLQRAMARGVARRLFPEPSATGTEDLQDGGAGGGIEL